MEGNDIKKSFWKKHKKILYIFLCFFILFIFFLIFPTSLGKITFNQNNLASVSGINIVNEEEKSEIKQTLDKEDYDRRMILLANNPPQPKPTIKQVKQPDGTIKEEIIPAPLRVDKWPKKTVYPNFGALLPFNRIVAYYGNLYSKKMGVLGEYEESIMIEKLNNEVSKWELADPETPVIPALHYIAVVAQGAPGKDGKYRLRMPDSQIEKVLKIAEKIPNAIVFLDIQTGYSDVETEIPLLLKYLKLPNVHLGLDPEFSMKGKAAPGKIVGTMDGETDVNFAINYLDKIVKENNLPPKVLVVHRYTRNMLTNSQKITPTEDVQVVIHMDGWGGKQHKISTHKLYIYPEPVQFTGFKIFYKNDIKEKGTTIFEPQELLKLNPRPIYIQYQ